MSFSNPVYYVLNGAALGDLCAAAPVLKYGIEKYHATIPYKVVGNTTFRSLFPYIPDENFIDIKGKWPLPPGYSLRVLNPLKQQSGITRLTPSRVPLVQYAAINLLGRLLPQDKIRYIKLDPVPTDHLDLPVKYVVLVSTYHDAVRAWPQPEMLKTAEWIHSRGYTPVFIGKTEDQPIAIKSENISIPEYGIDLRNKTSIPELASVMAKAAAVVGMDSGPVHLAWTTQTPVVCGFNLVSPELRMIDRPGVQDFAIVPDSNCRFCQSDGNLDFWGFETCYSKTYECVPYMSAQKFISSLEQILGRE